MASSSGGVVVEFTGLTKRFGSLTAVDDLSFTVPPGQITGFLGPNGAGKTTTLRMLLGLVRPTSGTATIDGRAYADLDRPLAVVGAALEATDVHPGRTGRDHLRTIAAAAGIADDRVDELLEMTGIPAFARKRAGGYSTGMRQRLALAQSLLGDPRLLVLDEPANGLDPEGIRWLRGFLRHLSDDRGKTVLVSSHLLQEVEQTVDDVVIIANGTLVKQGAMADLGGGSGALVRTPDPAALAGVLARALGGVGSEPAEDGLLFVHSTDLQAIGDAALAAGLPVWELRRREADLEALFFELTDGRNRNLGEAV
jgi:ABC-2 type transport system ATP-binding protein